MRSHVFATALALAAVGCTSSEQAPPEPQWKLPDAAKPDPPEEAGKGKLDPLPWNPFATAHEGDWAIYVASGKNLVRDGPLKGRGSVLVKVLGIATVARVTGDDVPIFTRVPGVKTGEPVCATFSKKEAPALDGFVFGLLHSLVSGSERIGVDLLEVQEGKGKRYRAKDLDFWVAPAKDEKRTLAGREFACKKVAFEGNDTKGGRLSLTMWLSPEVKPLGVVALDGNLTVPEEPFDVEFSIGVAGFGTADATEWGKSAEEISVD
jgi:hypothetical protein